MKKMESHMKKVFIARLIPNIASTLLSKKYEVVVNENKNLSKEKLIEVMKDYDAILSTIPDIIDWEVLSHAKNMKVISNYAVGLDNIDVEYARSKNIAVFNLPDIVTNSTADLTFAIFLSLVRKICSAREYVKNDLWKAVDPDLFVGEELAGKTFGIIGFGRIGRAVAKRALGFGMKVIFSHNRELLEYEKVEGCKQVSKSQLLDTSDFISLHVPLTPENKYLVNIDLMKDMKKKPIIINVARGGVVNTDHLIEALKNGYIRGAALDVTDPEPLSGNHPLCSFDNCLIVPHIGTATIDCRYEMAKKAAENILNFLK